MAGYPSRMGYSLGTSLVIFTSISTATISVHLSGWLDIFLVAKPVSRLKSTERDRHSHDLPVMLTRKLCLVTLQYIQAHFCKKLNLPTGHELMFRMK